MRAVTVAAEPIVHVGGRLLTADWLRALTEIRVQQQLSDPTQCELAFRDADGAASSAHPFQLGASLRIDIPGHGDTLFDGELTALELAFDPSQGRELRARGYDPLHRLRKRCPVRSHVQVTASDLVRELVADLGLSVEAAEAGPLRQIVIQQNQSDLDLLVDETEACGLYLTLRDRTVHLITLEGLGAPIPLAIGDSLFEARFEVNADPACRSVSVSGWNPLRVDHHQGTAATPRVGRNVAAEAPPSAFGEKGEIVLSDEAGPDSLHAQALAQAELDRRFAGEVLLSGTAVGDPRLRPGSRVEVSGVGDPFAGQYVLTSVTHIVDGRVGYVSELSTAPPAPRRPRTRHAVVTKGVVTRVNDPDGLGRLRVSLPTFGSVETEWMGAVAPGAGRGKGLIISPDVGDQVLVLFVQDDPAQGLVLGGLYGAGGPPDAGIEGNSVSRYTLLTGKGQKVVFDDTGSVIRLENSAGSFVELAPGKVRVHATTKLDLEAPGHAVVIRGKSIDFERA